MGSNPLLQRSNTPSTHSSIPVQLLDKTFFFNLIDQAHEFVVFEGPPLPASNCLITRTPQTCHSEQSEESCSFRHCKNKISRLRLEMTSRDKKVVA